MKKLFVPLRSKPFQWFKSGRKEWELRGINSRFNEQTVRTERPVELRKGYNGESVLGKIDSYRIFEDLEKIPKSMDIQKIIPPASNKEEFLKKGRELLKDYDRFIVFKIKLD